MNVKRSNFSPCQITWVTIDRVFTRSASQQNGNFWVARYEFWPWQKKQMLCLRVLEDFEFSCWALVCAMIANHSNRVGCIYNRSIKRGSNSKWSIGCPVHAMLGFKCKCRLVSTKNLLAFVLIISTLMHRNVWTKYPCVLDDFDDCRDYLKTLLIQCIVLCNVFTPTRKKLDFKHALQ